MTGITAEGDVLSFYRISEDEELFCAFNLSDTPSAMTVPEGDWHHIGTEINSAGPGYGNGLTLGPWQPCLLRRKT